jgi:hypothetical protein
MKNIPLFLACLTASAFRLTGQNITAYVDNNGAFNIFDDGNTSIFEYQPPVSFKVGASCVAYLDVNQTFKIYYKGEIIKPYDDKVISNYTVTDNLVFFSAGNTCFVFDQGKTVKLLNGYYNQSVTDSLFVAQDYYTNSLQIYYKGNLATLATPASQYNYYSLGRTNRNYTYFIARNILAYVDKDTMKVFSNGQVKNLFTYPKQTSTYVSGSQRGLAVGKNIVAYIDPSSKNLVAFYKGSSYTLSSGAISDIQTADDMVSYRDSSGLNIFYAGKKYLLDELSKAPPSSFRFTGTPFTSAGLIKDSLLIFHTSGHYKVFNKGIITVIDDISENQFQISGSTIAWVDRLNNLNAFYDTKSYTLSTLMKPDDFEVHGNTIHFTVFPNTHKVFYKGKVY